MPVNGNPDPRPLSPRLSVYRWRPTMLASLLHRVSGLVLVLFVPLYLWLLHGMTGSPQSFAEASAWMHSPPGRLLLWLVGVSLVYHFCNGVRFLMLDAGWGESRRMMRLSARAVLAIAAIAAIGFGVAL